MQGCKENCGGQAKLSREHAEKIADVLCTQVKEYNDFNLAMPARLTEAREALTRELRLLAEVTGPF
ncbi:hypothetical protein [Ralstonia sp. NFACC01]|uniref:hypothetical protein n=1 Tax=Ralstonia sp. NFACC01 TaxID=1566294 RepID=UPI0008E898E1|nr:hypothetical protein [Ralstonia sp. NFACC01]SFO89598.1 hypothetical protein SAMN03159417_00519 [Ralstonia sp. NFACC01]